MAQSVKHKRSSVVTNGAPKLPTTQQISVGELAINFADGYETLSTVNSNNEIATFSSDSVLDKKFISSGAVVDAISAVTVVIQEDEYVTAQALNEQNYRITELEETHVYPEDIPTESSIANSGFTKNALTAFTETDPTVPAWAKAANKPSYTASEVGAMATSERNNYLSTATTYFDDVEYDSNTKRINFKKNNSVIDYVDATAFIKDGMVSSVTVSNGNLVVSFNTDAGREDITLGLTQIFNPNNYYDKTTSDGRYLSTATTIPNEESIVNSGFTKGVMVFTSGTGASSIVSVYGNNVASGELSYAEGNSTSATGKVSHTEGNKTIANGQGAHAEGSNTRANGTMSHAEGANTISDGQGSHSEGAGTIASGMVSHAEGWQTSALTKYSHSEGQNTLANGEASHAEGQSTYTENEGSHAEGRYTSGTGVCSHAEGAATLAAGNPSHAEGDSSIALGTGSHAEGSHTSATSVASHTEGYFTIARNFAEHATGFYNLSNGFTEGNSDTLGDEDDSGHTLYAIGVGYGESDRKNAFEVMQNGDTYLMGVGSYNGKNYSAATTLQKEINNKLSTGATLDSIADGSTRKLSDYYTKTQADDTFQRSGWYIHVDEGNLLDGVPLHIAGGPIATDNVNFYNYSGYYDWRNVYRINNYFNDSYDFESTSLQDDLNFLYSGITGAYATIANVTASDVGALPTGTTLDNIADGTTRKLSNYSLTSHTHSQYASTAHTHTAAEVGALPSTTEIPTQASILSSGFTKNAGTLTGVTINGSAATVSNGNASLNIELGGSGSGLPTVSASDNGKILQVVNGQWQLVTPITLRTGTGAPSASLGNVGDVYVQTA